VTATILICLLKAMTDQLSDDPDTLHRLASNKPVDVFGYDVVLDNKVDNTVDVICETKTQIYMVKDKVGNRIMQISCKPKLSPSITIFDKRQSDDLITLLKIRYGEICNT